MAHLNCRPITIDHVIHLVGYGRSFPNPTNAHLHQQVDAKEAISADVQNETKGKQTLYKNGTCCNNGNRGRSFLVMAE